jgi:hypothetical protein
MPVPPAKHAGLTVFILFFGISLLDALRGGHWLRAGLWLLLGLVFYALERRRVGQKAASETRMY